jgi:hypothetical protein
VALAVKQRFEAAGKSVDIIDCSQFAFPRRINITKKQSNLGKLILLKPRRMPALSDGVSDVLVTSFDQASVGALKSFLRDDQPRDSHINRALRKAMTSRAFALYFQAKEILTKNSYNEVVMPNGRFVHEKALLFAADDLNLKISFYEIGTSNRSYTLCNYAPQSRGGLKRDYEDSKIDSIAGAEDFVLNWLQRRQSQVQENIFSALWSGAENFPQDKFRNAFFTSSTDEIGALGEDWKLDTWLDQYEAFDCILSKLEEIEPDGESALRVHPNLINKSRRMYRREIDRIQWLAARHPNLKVFWHNDPQNSYEIVQKSNRVFVSLSSIGIEATLLEKPLWVTSASHYDESIGVRKIFSREDLESVGLEEFFPDFENAVAFKYFELTRQTALGASVRNDLSKISKYVVYPFADLSLLGMYALLYQIHLSALSSVRKTFFLINKQLKFSS